MGLFSKKSDHRYDALYAEYQNYRRRTVQELQSAGIAAAKQTVLPFLSLYDDLSRALAANCSDEAYYKGIELIYKNLMATFAQLKIAPMDSKGKIFNPTYHEAIEQISDKNYRTDEIVEVVQVGFLMDDEVIRHAKVIVANCS